MLNIVLDVGYVVLIFFVVLIFLVYKCYLIVGLVVGFVGVVGGFSVNLLISFIDFLLLGIIESFV